jgi:hypothetical protein
MHVVWHDHPSAEIVESPFAGSHQDGVGNQRGDAVVPEPQWTGGEPIRDTVDSREGVTGSPITSGYHSDGKRSPKTPRQE